MSRARALTPEVAQQLKEEMFGGAPHEELMRKYPVGYQTLINIKGGKQYGDIPWPDGSMGPMAQMQSMKLREQKKFNTRVQNNAAHSTGRHTEFSNPDWEKPLRIDIADEFMAKYPDFKGIPSEKTISEYFWKKRNEEKEELYKKKHEEYMRKGRIKQAKLDKEREKYLRDVASGKIKEEPKLPPMADPDANEKRDWDEIMAIGDSIPVVNVANQDGPESLKLAIRIIFKILSPSQWADDVYLKTIYKVKKEIETFWEYHPEQAPQDAAQSEAAE
jgi:hypothetical protein